MMKRVDLVYLCALMDSVQIPERNRTEIDQHTVRQTGVRTDRQILSLSLVSQPVCFLWLFVDVVGLISSARSWQECEKMGETVISCFSTPLLVLSYYCECSD